MEQDEQEKINRDQKEENANTNRNINYVARSSSQVDQAQREREKGRNDLQDHINEETKEQVEALFKHANVANHEMGKIVVKITELATNVQWLLKFFWLVATASVGSLIASIMNLWHSIPK